MVVVVAVAVEFEFELRLNGVCDLPFLQGKTETLQQATEPAAAEPAEVEAR